MYVYVCELTKLKYGFGLLKTKHCRKNITQERVNISLCYLLLYNLLKGKTISLLSSVEFEATTVKYRVKVGKSAANQFYTQDKIRLFVC